MVVVNITNADLRIPEIRSIVPADGKHYIIPYEIAIRYKHALSPIQMADEPAPIPASSEPLTNQIHEMNSNAVSHFQQLRRELGITELQPTQAPTETKAVTVESFQDDKANWANKSKYDRIVEIWENNPEWSCVKIAEYSQTSYVYTQKTILKLKKLQNGLSENA